MPRRPKGRVPGWIVVVAAAALSAAAAFALVALGSSGGNGSTVALSKLVAHQTAYEGREVRTAGFLRRFVDPDGSAYYLLEDRRGDRVMLVPAHSAEPFRGKRVEASGRFHLMPGRGREIEVGGIRVRPPTARPPS